MSGNKIGALESVRREDSTRKLMNGLSFTVEKLDERYNCDPVNRIIEVDETTPGKPEKRPVSSSERESDSDPRSHAPSLNPQVSDVRQFAPNYDDLHGYLELYRWSSPPFLLFIQLHQRNQRIGL